MSPDGTVLLRAMIRSPAAPGHPARTGVNSPPLRTNGGNVFTGYPMPSVRNLSRGNWAPSPDRPIRVLDVGCGQGTQALKLAELGHHVTGLDPSPAMLADFAQTLAAKPPRVQARVRLIHGEVEQLETRGQLAPCRAVAGLTPDAGVPEARP